MTHWIVGILAAVTLALVFLRSGAGKVLGDPVTFFALALLAGSLGSILKLADGSTIDSALVAVEIVSTIYGCYLLVLRERGPGARRRETGPPR